jgi:hypothetical protein
VLQLVRSRIRALCTSDKGSESEARSDVAIHTVCQHVYWDRLLPIWAELGVTDLHLSHCSELSAALAAPFGIRTHSWPLVAPNIVNEDRREGIVVGKPLQQRRWLASFIGAHMDCYRSDARRRLHAEAIRSERSDVVFDLKDSWHFLPIVYQQQVRGEALTPDQSQAERAATVRYNQVLSDSVFSLCPEGTGPNTLRLWESLAVGAIPVVIAEGWMPPPVPGENLAWEDAVIFLRQAEIDGLYDRLAAMRRDQTERLEAMRRAAMALYRRFEDLRCF